MARERKARRRLPAGIEGRRCRLSGRRDRARGLRRALARPARLERRAILARGAAPVEVRRGLPGGEEDTHSRYLEAEIGGIVVASLYLPNGNPISGPKFDYKLAWFERLIAYAAGLYESDAPVVLAGDFNVVPTDFDIYNPASWRRDALLQPQTRACYERLLAQGWVDALRVLHPGERIYTFWDYFRNHWQRNAGLRIDHLLVNRALAPRLAAAGVDAWVRGQPGASDHAPTWIELAPHVRKRTAAKKAARKAPAKRARQGSAQVAARRAK